MYHGDLFRRRLAPQLLLQLPHGARHAVDRLDHVHRDANGARLVGDGPADGLANPPGGIGAELEALAIVELFHGAQQAQVAFLDQVQERHAAAHVALGHADHQAQVGLGQAALGNVALHDLELAASGAPAASGHRLLLRGARVASSPLPMALARRTSSSASSSDTRPISRRYMRTGSLTGSTRRAHARRPRAPSLLVNSPLRARLGSPRAPRPRLPRPVDDGDAHLVEDVGQRLDLVLVVAILGEDAEDILLGEVLLAHALGQQLVYSFVAFGVFGHTQIPSLDSELLPGLLRPTSVTA